MTTKATAAKAAPAPKSTAVQLTAREIMQSPVIAATPQASLRDLAVRLVTEEFSGMPVAAPDGRVVGVITEADIIRALIDGKRLENLTAGEVICGGRRCENVARRDHEVPPAQNCSRDDRRRETRRHHCATRCDSCRP